MHPNGPPRNGARVVAVGRVSRRRSWLPQSLREFLEDEDVYSSFWRPCQSPSAVRTHRLARHGHPPAEVSRLCAGRPIPWNVDRPEVPEPAQQVHPVGAQRRLGPRRRLKIPQERRHRLHRCAGGVKQPERQPRDRPSLRPHRSAARPQAWLRAQAVGWIAWAEGDVLASLQPDATGLREALTALAVAAVTLAPWRWHWQPKTRHRRGAENRYGR
jgi:hypothetical protein